jgi:TonB family protein
MRYACVFCLALLLCASTAYGAQNSDPKELPANKGSLVGGNSYNNPALGLSLSLPGEWQFFDRTAYSTPEQKQRDKEMLEKAKVNCQGALCGPVEIDVALQSPLGPPPKYSIYLSAHKLAPEYQNRDRYPLRKFAETMSLGSLGANWVSDGELTPIMLGGRPAYRLIIHNSHVTTAKGFLYVADSNGQVFMLLGVAKSDPLPLQSALESLRFTNTPILVSQPEPEPQIAKTGSVDSYPNTSDGLHRLLNDFLLSAKNDDQARLWSQVAETEIPNYEGWFTRTFGPVKGKNLAGKYASSLKPSKLQFQMLCTELAKQTGEVSIEKVDVAKKYGALPGPLDEYRASWKKTDDSPGPDSQPIGFFYYVDGKFRLDPSLHEIRVLSPNKTGTITLGKLIDRVQPIYPDAARKLRIQGAVAINVIVRKDGTVSVQNVGAGHPLLAPAAVEAVQQWRYEPTTVNGEPVDIQTKVYVVFALNNPPDQK